jgi:hypothetical protein
MRRCSRRLASIGMTPPVAPIQIHRSRCHHSFIHSSTTCWWNLSGVPCIQHLIRTPPLHAAPPVSIRFGMRRRVPDTRAHTHTHGLDMPSSLDGDRPVAEPARRCVVRLLVVPWDRTYGCGYDHAVGGSMVPPPHQQQHSIFPHSRDRRCLLGRLLRQTLRSHAVVYD